jgi:magnesium chelatase accessory protein
MTSAAHWQAVADVWPLAESSRFISLDGADYHVQISGKGPDVLLLHGAGASSHSFAGVTPLLNSHFRVIAPDLPGQGFSSLLPPERVGLVQFSNHLSALLEQLGAAPQWIIGHSAGAALATQYALNSAESLRGILCINPAFNPFGSMAAPFFSLAAKWLARSHWLPRALASPSLRWRATGSMLADTGSSIDPIMSQCYDTLLGDPDHIAGTLRMMAGWDLPPLLNRLGELQLPVWLAACEGDRTIPPSRSTAAHRYFTHCRTLLIPELGHLGHEEAPETFADLLQTLITSTQS